MTDVPKLARHQLLFRLADFKAGFRALRHMAEKPARFRAAQFSMEFDGRFATFVAPGIAFSVNASGEWLGRVSFSSSLMIGLFKVPPTEDPVTVRTDTKRIWIEGTSVPCTWQEAVIEDGATFVSLPEPMDRLHMLQMLESWSKDELYKQGFQNHIRRAKAWRYTRIVKALESLGELGVTYDDLAHVVELALKRQGGKE